MYPHTECVCVCVCVVTFASPGEAGAAGAGQRPHVLPGDTEEDSSEP